MKVYQILENNDFSNQPISLSYLDKKQASACEHFKYEVIRLIKLHPTDSNLSSRLSRWSLLLSMFSLSVRLASSYSSWLSLFIKYPTLKTKVDEIIDAKKKYEEAGGKYKLNI